MWLSATKTVLHQAPRNTTMRNKFASADIRIDTQFPSAPVKIHANGPKKPRPCSPQIPIRPKLSDGSFLTSDHVSASLASPATRENQPIYRVRIWRHSVTVQPRVGSKEASKARRPFDLPPYVPPEYRNTTRGPSAALHIPLSSCNLKYPYHGWYHISPPLDRSSSFCKLIPHIGSPVTDQPYKRYRHLPTA